MEGLSEVIMLKKIQTYLLEHIKGIIFILGIGIIAVIGYVTYWCMAMDSIVINEVCSNNFSAHQDEQMDYPDYIELYNPGNMAISLEGMCLSDSKDVIKYEFGDTGIAPKSYYIVYPDEKYGNRHMDFSLNKDGDSIYLWNRWGKIIDFVDLPKLEYNTSYSRVKDGAPNWERRTATPEAPNELSEKVTDPDIERVDFSKDGGFYEEEFYLSLEGTENTLIYYTLDGSEPTTESECYKEPIFITEVSQEENRLSARDDLAPRKTSVPDFKVDKAMVVRAAVYDSEREVFGESTAKTYFIGYEEKKEYDNLPIISMVTDPKNLFDFEYGIYGNGARYQKYLDEGGLVDGKILDSYENEKGRMVYFYTASNAFNDGKEWEREAQIEYFDAEHKKIFAQDVGIRTAGQSTRTRTHKSFNLYARDIYDEQITLKFHWNNEEVEWKTIKLRNGGNESDHSKIREPFIHSLVKERNVSVQDAVPYILFINGEYWGIYSMRERYKNEYVERHYGVEENDVWIMDSERPENGEAEAQQAYDELMAFMKIADFTNEDNYNQLCDMIDMQSFIDFYCINLYIGNTDAAFDKNVALWRSSVIKEQEFYDGKWRWMLYDLDMSGEKYEENTLDEAINGLMRAEAFKNLLRSDIFREDLYSTFDEIANTCFEAEHVNRELDVWVEKYKEQVLKSHRQFVSNDYSEEEYEVYIKEIRTFFEKRSEYIYGYLDEYLKLYE